MCPPDADFPLTTEEEKRRLRSVDGLVAESERREQRKKWKPPSDIRPFPRNDSIGTSGQDTRSNERETKVRRPASSNLVTADNPVEEASGASKPLSDMEDAKRRRRRGNDSGMQVTNA